MLVLQAPGGESSVMLKSFGGRTRCRPHSCKRNCCRRPSYRRSVVGDLGAVGRAPGGESNMVLATLNSDGSATSEGEQADSTLRLPVASTSPTSTWTSVSVAGAFGAVAVAGGCFNHAVAIDVASIHLGGRRQNGHRKDCNRHGRHRQVCR